MCAYAEGGGGGWGYFNPAGSAKRCRHRQVSASLSVRFSLVGGSNLLAKELTCGCTEQQIETGFKLVRILELQNLLAESLPHYGLHPSSVKEKYVDFQ